MPKHAKYHMPSGEMTDFSMTEIESRFLSRKATREAILSHTACLIIGLTIGVIVVSLLHFFVEPKIIPQAKAQEILVNVKGENISLSDLCAQYIRDGHTLTGDLKDSCK